MREYLQKICKFWIRSGAKVCESCRSWKMLKNDYLLAKIGFDTAENEPSKVWLLLLLLMPYCLQWRENERKLNTTEGNGMKPLPRRERHTFEKEKKYLFFLFYPNVPKIISTKLNLFLGGEERYYKMLCRNRKIKSSEIAAHQNWAFQNRVPEPCYLFFFPSSSFWQVYPRSKTQGYVGSEKESIFQKTWILRSSLHCNKAKISNEILCHGGVMLVEASPHTFYSQFLPHFLQNCF